MKNVEIVNNILIEYFEIEIETIKPELDLRQDLEFDSLDAVDMLIILEEKVSSKIDADDFFKCKTVEDVYMAVNQYIEKDCA